MALSSTLTFDQTTPRRPTVNDFGGAAFQDDARRPPDPTAHPSAGMFNQIIKQVVALANVSPSMKIQVEFVAGSPKITQLVTMGTGILVTDFTVTLNGVGDVSITLPQSKFPQELTRASGLTIVEDVEIDRARIVVIPGGGWRIKTKLGATGTNAAFVFQVN